MELPAWYISWSRQSPTVALMVNMGLSLLQKACYISNCVLMRTEENLISIQFTALLTATFQVSCVTDGEVKAVGETWHSEDHCTIYTCAKNINVSIDIFLIKYIST